MIRVEEVVRRFQVEEGTLEVIRGVSFTVEQGEMTAIIGPSGAGKSTLLHIMGALDRPTAGKIVFDDRDLYSSHTEAELALFRSEKIGFIFQAHMLLPEFTARENVALAAMIRGQSRDEAMEKGAGLLRDIGLGARLDHRPGKLSGGEQQRVAIARALVNDPALVLADEPTGNLDSKTGDAVFQSLLEQNHQRKQTFIIVTHNRDLASRMDRIMTMQDGLIVEDQGL